MIDPSYDVMKGIGCDHSIYMLSMTDSLARDRERAFLVCGD